jgi:predicted amidophosphoribosyltransferase
LEKVENHDFGNTFKVTFNQCLKRIETVKAKHNGGDRSGETDRNTIQYESENKIANVILIDDIITTGTSFKICKEKLIYSGVKNIISIALGKTERKK